MDNTMITMNAVVCVPSARPRTAGVVLLADTRIGVQGTVVSLAARTGLGAAVAGAPFGVPAATVKGYLTTDVVRSRSGRPPV